jgi:ectoine hydroxylase-related dioxygenase (phytanoyl-CoA dioxygenase family)
MNLPRVLEALRRDGFAVVEGVLDAAFLSSTRDAMYRAQAAIRREAGEERLAAAGERGVLRLMMKFEPIFFRFLEFPELLEVVDATVSNTAIMHLQNGFILPPEKGGAAAEIFQHQFHRDFPRHLNGYVASVNAFFAIDDFSAANGATLVVPGSHQKPEPPSDDERKKAVPLECAAGSMIVFDSTLWHAAGVNASGADRLAINHQFTRSFFKQQIDYVRALDAGAVAGLPERTQQILGNWTKVVTSLEEYYRPEAKRLYRKGQG